MENGYLRRTSDLGAFADRYSCFLQRSEGGGRWQWRGGGAWPRRRGRAVDLADGKGGPGVWRIAFYRNLDRSLTIAAAQTRLIYFRAGTPDR